MNVPVILRRRRPGVSPLAIYAVLGIRPELVLDFDDEKYFANSLRSTFSNAITHSATTNATMVDSDGLLKWRPHNLLTYSEDFSNAAWVKQQVTVSANAEVAPDGTTTADKLVETTATNVHRFFGTVASGVSGAAFTFSIYIKAAERTAVRVVLGGSGVGADIGADFNLSDGTKHSEVGSPVAAIITNAGGGFYKIVVTVTTTTTGVINPIVYVSDTPGTITYTGDGTSGIYLWGAHLYRSDLGGMANNPDRGDSYVPTTSSAVYLPRRGHHVYNGSAWVNEGLLHESEARVNLVTSSNDFDVWSIANTNSLTVTANQETGRDGETSLAKVAITDTTSESHEIYRSFTGVAGSTYTLSVDAKYGTHPYWALRFWTAANNWIAVVFDLSSGQITQSSAGSNGVAVLSSIEQHGDIYRISMSGYTTSGTTMYIAIDACSSATPTLSASTGVETFSGTAGVYSYLGFAQVEAASTPSSYIPTSGSTVTRAAETLTVPSAKLPWPEPVYIGPELVTNGTFDTDTSGWTSTAPATATWDAGQVDIARNSGSSVQALYQTRSFTIGSVYEVSIDVAAVSHSVGLFSTGGGVPIGASITSTGTHKRYFVGKSGDDGIYVGAGGSTTATATVDNISVREIDPLAVSIQMQGRMTIEDNGLSLPVRWYKSSDDRIQLYKESNNWFFYQRSGGTLDVVSKFDPSAGTLVPFNIASRHGSTFVNGAVDGTALTADTTPTALPDLSATDLKLGFDYMGCIKLLRIWSADLGDAGISEASTS